MAIIAVSYACNSCWGSDWEPSGVVLLSPDEFSDSEAMLRLLSAREWFWEAAVLAPKMCEGTTRSRTTMKTKYLVTSNLFLQCRY